MSKIKVTEIVSDIDKALAFEWVALGLKGKFDLCFIIIGISNSKFSIFLKNHAIRFHEISNEKYPSRISKWLRLFFILLNEKPDVVHAHLWNANLLGLSSAWLLRVKKRIYTRHHATIHYDQFPSGRKWDVLCNRMATHIVAISLNVESILVDRDKADPEKVHLIHHGFDFNFFKSVTDERVNILRNKFNLRPETYPVIGVISRYVEWKGIQYIIQAFQKILIQYPLAKLVLANAHGDYEATIQGLLQALPKNSCLEIRFEEDLPALYQLFDVFVHVPVDPTTEAFGQTYVESLIKEIPSIFTLSGIAREFVKHKHNAWVVDFKSSDQIAEGINAILSNNKLKETLQHNGEKSVQQFSLDHHILGLEKLYTD